MEKQVLGKNTHSMYLNIKEYSQRVVAKWYYYVPMLLSTLISFAFTIFNRSLFIDDLVQNIYYGQEMLKIKSLRWGQALTAALFSTKKYTPFINQFFGILFLILTAIVLGSILYKLDKNKSFRWKYVIFSCMFVSYPLITEFFGYFESLTIPFHFFIVSLVLLYELSIVEKKTSDYFAEGLILSIVMAGYESLIIAYISEVMLVLFIKYVVNYKDGYKAKDWVLEGFEYAKPLFVALVLRFVIGYILVALTNNIGKTQSDGSTAIYWLTTDYKTCIYNILVNIRVYFIRGLSFFPISEFAIALVLFIGFCIYKRRDSKFSIILGFLLVGSLFLLSILQGDKLHYRQAQSVQLFVAYVAYLIMDQTANTKLFNRSVNVVLALLLIFVCFRQSIFTHRYLALDNQRSDNERQTIQNIGHLLFNDYDRNKTVIFCGKYHLGSNIESQIYIDTDGLENKFMKLFVKRYRSDMKRKMVETNVTSVLNWAIKAFNNQDMMKELFSYYGYEINVSEDYFDAEVNKKYEKIALKNGMRSLEVKDMGDYILVYLGKID